MQELKNVMLVDDDIDIQEAAQLGLDAIGEFNLTICSSGDEALAKVKEVKPQLILLDVAMPGKDGPTTLKELQKIPEASSIPVVFLTASVEPHQIAAYKQMGVTDVISKPFDPTTLAETLIQIWKQE